MNINLTHSRMVEEILRREASKLAKVSSQIISNHEPTVDTILSDLKDANHERYVGSEKELLALISNGKVLNIIIESEDILSVDIDNFDTANRSRFVEQIYEKLTSKISK